MAPWPVVATESDVRRIALSLPGAFEQASYGGLPSWRTKPRMFAWIRGQPDALVVWVASEDERQALLAAAPQKFVATSHYDGHPAVLVDLHAIDVAEATELITNSWRARGTQPPR